MRIFNQNGDFDLPADFFIEVTKTNPLFSEQGEMTASITLPATPNNKALTNFGARLDNAELPTVNIDVCVQHETFCKKATMTIESYATDQITATLYFTAGDFYALIDGKNLIQDIEWKEIAQSKGLWEHDIYETRSRKQVYNTEYSLPEITLNHVFFQLKIYDGSTSYYENYLPMILNQNIKNYEIFNLPADVFSEPPFFAGDSLAYWNAEHGTYKDKESDPEITMPTFFMITPQLYLNYVLQEIFTKFGFIFTPPAFFDDVLIASNVADALCGRNRNGDFILRYSQLLPNVEIKEFIEAVENNFGGKFAFQDNRATFVRITDRINDPNNIATEAHATEKISLAPTLIPKTYSIEPVVADNQEKSVATFETLPAFAKSDEMTEKKLYSIEGDGEYGVRRMDIFVPFSKHVKKEYTKDLWHINASLYNIPTELLDEKSKDHTTIKTPAITINTSAQRTNSSVEAYKTIYFYNVTALLDEPIYLNTEVRTTKDGETSTTSEQDNEQTDNIVFLKQETHSKAVAKYLDADHSLEWSGAGDYYSLYFYEGKTTLTAMPLPYAPPLPIQLNMSQYDGNDELKSIEASYKKQMLEYTKQSASGFLRVTTEMRIKTSEIAVLDITQPTMLKGRKVFFEEINYTVPDDGEPQSVTLRTVN